MERPTPGAEAREVRTAKHPSKSLRQYETSKMNVSALSNTQAISRGLLREPQMKDVSLPLQSRLSFTAISHLLTSSRHSHDLRCSSCVPSACTLCAACTDERLLCRCRQPWRSQKAETQKSGPRRTIAHLSCARHRSSLCTVYLDFPILL